MEKENQQEKILEDGFKKEICDERAVNVHDRNVDLGNNKQQKGDKVIWQEMKHLKYEENKERSSGLLRRIEMERQNLKVESVQEHELKVMLEDTGIKEDIRLGSERYGKLGMMEVEEMCSIEEEGPVNAGRNSAFDVEKISSAVISLTEDNFYFETEKEVCLSANGENSHKLKIRAQHKEAESDGMDLFLSKKRVWSSAKMDKDNVKSDSAIKPAPFGDTVKSWMLTADGQDKLEANIQKSAVFGKVDKALSLSLEGQHQLMAENGLEYQFGNVEESLNLITGKQGNLAKLGDSNLKVEGFGDCREAHILTTEEQNEKEAKVWKRSTLFGNIEEEAQQMFSKKFVFEGAEKWSLPPPEEMCDKPWKIESLLAMKEELNAVKELLSDKDITRWHGHTHYTNKAGNIVNSVRRVAYPELCTQAWCKFYEMVSDLPLISCKVQQLNTLHLCEAPGAFVTALNHYLRLNHSTIHWKWLATTLNPYYEGNSLGSAIMDDRFISETLSHWHFGLNDTGDLMDPDNLSSLKHAAEELNPILLVTADGSIDCHDDPGEQENRVSSLHLCEAVTALLLLHQGGSLLIKMFTVVEHASICLLYLLCCSFETCTMMKPASSKAGNSEVYVACLGYRGVWTIRLQLDKLLANFGCDLGDKSVFNLQSLPSDFIDSIHRCAKLFKDHQEAQIALNLSLYEDMTSEQEQTLNHIKQRVAELYIIKCQLEPIRKKHRITPFVRRPITGNSEALKRGWGSYNEQRETSSDTDGRIKDLLTQIASVGQGAWPEQLILVNNVPLTTIGLKISVGLTFHGVINSKMCSLKILIATNELENLISKPHVACNRHLKMSGEVIHIAFSDLDSFLSDTINILKNFRGSSLVICDLDLITRLHVGILWILRSAFQKVGFVFPRLGVNHTVLMDFKGSLAAEQVIENLHTVQLEMKRVSDTGRQVQQVIPIQLILHDAMFPYLVQYNNTRLSEKASVLVANHKS